MGGVREHLHCRCAINEPNTLRLNTGNTYQDICCANSVAYIASVAANEISLTSESPRGYNSHTMNRATTFAGLLLSFLAPSIGASADVPVSPYLKYVYQYADAMLAEGRDTFGPQPTGLFLSALDRTTMKPLTVRPAPDTTIDR